MITKKTYDLLEAKLKPHLEAIAKDIGISIRIGGGSFRPNEGSLKLKLLSIGENGKVVDTSADEFKAFAVFYRLSPDDLGKTFTSRGHLYTITGMSRRRHKMPINATRSDGKAFKFPADYVRICLSGGLNPKLNLVG